MSFAASANQTWLEVFVLKVADTLRMLKTCM